MGWIGSISLLSPARTPLPAGDWFLKVIDWFLTSPLLLKQFQLKSFVKLKKIHQKNSLTLPKHDFKKVNLLFFGQNLNPKISCPLPIVPLFTDPGGLLSTFVKPLRSHLSRGWMFFLSAFTLRGIMALGTHTLIGVWVYSFGHWLPTPRVHCC